MLPAARKLNAAEPLSTIPAPAPIEEAPRALTSGDYEAIADLGREELAFDFETVAAQPPQSKDFETVDAEIVGEDHRAG